MLRPHTGWSHWFITSRPQTLIVIAVVLYTEACLTCRKISYSSHTNPLIFSAAQLPELWYETPFHIDGRNCSEIEVQNTRENRVMIYFFSGQWFSKCLFTAQYLFPERMVTRWNLSVQHCRKLDSCISQMGDNYFATECIQNLSANPLRITVLVCLSRLNQLLKLFVAHLVYYPISLKSLRIKR